MKTILSLLLLLLLCVSCQKKEKIKGFYVTIDTLNISLPGEVGGGVKLNNKYYLYNWDKQTNNDFDLSTYLCIFNKRGTLTDSIYVPAGMTMTCKLIVQHDSIMLNSTENNWAYYLDENNGKWIELKHGNYNLFEDNSYRITSSDFGEWGGATWFKDKKTSIQYETNAIMPEIQKANGQYYLISAKNIDVIKKPKLLPAMGKSDFGTDAGTKGFKEYYSRKRPKNRLQGVEQIFEDTIYDYNHDTGIRKSFIHNDSLYFIMQDTAKTYIAKMYGKQITPLIILKNIGVAEYLNIYRNINGLTIPFKNNKTGQHGMLEINGKNIYLHYIKNTPPKK